MSSCLFQGFLWDFFRFQLKKMLNLAHFASGKGRFPGVPDSGIV